MFIIGSSIKSFGEFVEHAAVFVGIIDACIRLINIRIWKNQIIEIATSFKELKKFDENEIVKKREIFIKRITKIWLILDILIAFKKAFSLVPTYFLNGFTLKALTSQYSCGSLIPSFWH
jgi:hypothetical protein